MEHAEPEGFVQAAEVRSFFCNHQFFDLNGFYREQIEVVAQSVSAYSILNTSFDDFILSVDFLQRLLEIASAAFADTIGICIDRVGPGFTDVCRERTVSVRHQGQRNLLACPVVDNVDRAEAFRALGHSVLRRIVVNKSALQHRYCDAPSVRDAVRASVLVQLPRINRELRAVRIRLDIAPGDADTVRCLVACAGSDTGGAPSADGQDLRTAAD